MLTSSFYNFLALYLTIEVYDVCICEGLWLSDASEMAKEEVNRLGGKYHEGKKNCNSSPPVAPITETNVVMYDEDSQCNKYCPKECNSDSSCVCQCVVGLSMLRYSVFNL